MKLREVSKVLKFRDVVSDRAQKGTQISPAPETNYLSVSRGGEFTSV